MSSTGHHHIAHIKGTPQGSYYCVILDREFNFSDQLETVISGFYGHEVAQVSFAHIRFKTNLLSYSSI
jgi:hypothetical protein